MDKLNYYKGLLVDQTHLAESFDGAEAAIGQVLVDLGAEGIVEGFGVEEAVPPAFAVLVRGGLARDRDGQRLSYAGAPSLDCTLDAEGEPTAVLNVGNERWLSIIATYAPETYDNVDPDDLPALDLRSRDGAVVTVLQGAEAAAGAAVRPTVPGGSILLADVLIAHGQATIVNADLDTTRVEAFSVGVEAAGGGGGGSSLPVPIPLAGKHEVNGLTGLLAVEQRAFAANDYPSTTLTFHAVLSKTNTGTARVRLYRLASGGGDVLVATLTAADGTPTAYQTTLTVGSAAVTPTSNVYEVRVENLGADDTHITHVGSVWMTATPV